MPRRFRAPAGNGAVLADPGFDAVPALVEANRRRLDVSTFAIDDWNHDGDLDLFRTNARIEAIVEAWDYLGSAPRLAPVSGRIRHIPSVSDDGPLIVAGHQPELSHPGVWVKNFALSGVARKLRGTALNLVVDNDLPKAAAVQVPRTAPGVAVVPVVYDHPPEVPYESGRVLDPALFASFADRVEAELPRELGTPLIRRAWEVVRGSGGVPVGEAFARARRKVEREWGCDNLELPVSRLADGVFFMRFAFHIARHADRFARVYNDAVADYRRRNGLRSRVHPVPDLARDGEWQEIPLWAWSEKVPRRGRVWVRRTGATRLSFRFDNGLPDLTEQPDQFGGFTADHGALWNREYLFRPRALTLTLFARVCLGDFFIHGIGGGKYDEVTDDIIRHYVGLEPPAYQVLSATLHLPLPGFPATAADARRAERHVRDLRWNPQRHLSPEAAARPEVSSLLREKERLAAAEPPYREHAARRAWFRDLATVTAKLRGLVTGDVPGAEAAADRARAEAHANAVLRRRDYSWVLYPEDTLRPFLQRFLDV